MINKTDTKRAVPLVLTAALLLSGCGVNGTSAGQNQKPDGVQEETQVQTAEVKKVAILSTAESRIVADSTDIKAGTGIAYQDTDFSTPEDYFYKYSNVDYGEIDDRVTYYSSTIGEDKQCGVLLPPRYDTSKKYPVVYLLHGFGGDHFDWNRGDCYVQDIYGNMLANNTAVPAIVVMPDMYTAPADTKETADGEQKRAAYDKLVYDLENDLMPYIESHYAVKTGRENTAIIGTSQGGTEALAIGFLLQDKIGYIGSLAPCPGVSPTPYNEGTYWNTPLMDDFTIESPAMAPYYLQLAAGTTDPWCLEPTKYYENVLTDEQIAHTYYLLDGAGHEDSVWENGLYQFFKRIFKQ